MITRCSNNIDSLKVTFPGNSSLPDGTLFQYEVALPPPPRLQHFDNLLTTVQLSSKVKGGTERRVSGIVEAAWPSG